MTELGSIEEILDELIFIAGRGGWFEIDRDDAGILLEYIQSLGGAK